MNQQRRTVVAALAAAGLPLSVFAQGKIVLGFSQIGAESEWRTANTESIKSAAEGGRHRAEVLRRAAEAGEPDQGAALVHRAEGRRDRVLAGGRNRLGHGAARGQGREDPGDPVGPRGRREGRHRCTSRFIGSDFVEEGRKAGRWLLENYKGQGDVNIVELQGTVGSAPAIDRKKGFEEIIKAQIRASRSSARRPATSRAPRARK